MTATILSFEEQDREQELKILQLVKKILRREREENNGMQWRTWDKLVSDMLKVIAKHQPIVPTRIMYLAQINTVNANRNINRLLEQKLILVDKETRKISLTEKGRKLQRLLQKRDKLFNPGLRVNV